MKRNIAIVMTGIAVAATGATAMAASHPTKSSGEDVEVGQLTGVRSVSDAVAAYAELRRPAHAGDVLSDISPRALVRRVGTTHTGQPTYLLLDRASNRLCVIVAIAGKESGGSACSIAEGVNSRPPILLHLKTPAGGVGMGQLVGAAPDGVRTVVVTDSAGKEHRLSPVDNLFAVPLSTLRSDQVPVRHIVFELADGAVSQAWPVVR